MMLIKFRQSAEQDLRELLAYLDTNAPASTQSVVDDLARSLETISSFPSAGTKVQNRDYRRIISPRFHFKIVYEVTSSQINVLGILRHQARAF